VARVDDRVTDAERIRFAFGKSSRDDRPFGALLELRHGWCLLCTWDRSVEDLSGIFELNGREYCSEDLMFHPQRVNFDHGKKSVGLSLDFDWSGRWSPTKNQNVVKLRPKYRSPRRK
jgi:hypothetical protein